MCLESGRRLGPYEIIEPAGAGGMGEVYKAKDTRLERTVAIKVLPEHLSAEPELRKRFEQEARTISNLNHPRICTLHDIGSEDSVDFLVMEFLEGETLAERLQRGSLRLDEALTYARQIADALDKAHRSGVVHRDLKPGNIMLTKDGVKLLDFGLAKLQTKGLDPALSSLPTQDQPLTREGSIVGTLHYMAPEQLEGKDVDARADMFAFGAVLYEMITGHKAFDGETPASIITAVMSTTPPSMAALKPITPTSLERLVESCLTKDRDARWQSAGDLGRELSWVGSEREIGSARPSSKFGWWAAALFAVMALGVLAYVPLRDRPRPPLVHFTIPPPDGASFGALRAGTNPTVSPDGTRIAFLVEREGAVWLAVRAIGEPNTQVLTETDPGQLQNFAWSPDSVSLLYPFSGKLLRIDVDGGAPEVVSDFGVNYGMAWSSSGAILLVENQRMRRIDDGGEFQLTRADGEAAHIRPQFLPDGKHFLFHITNADPEKTGIYSTSLDSTDKTLVRTAGSAAHYVEPGYILFVDGETLFAQRFDPSSRSVDGQPTPLMRGVFAERFSTGTFSASRDVLAYSEGSRERSLIWFDRDGKSLGAIGEPAPYRTVAVSPDGRRAVAGRDASLWLLDLERGGIATRLTPESIQAIDPAWAPDGRELVLSSTSARSWDLYRLSLAAGSTPELILSAKPNLWVDQWLAADDQIAFHDTNTISLMPMNQAPEPRELVQQEATLDEAHRSPDGRWLAFISEETGRYEVYVQRLDIQERSRVSSRGGGQPRWRRDGTELFYISGDSKMMAIGFDTESGVQGVARPLFDVPSSSNDPRIDEWDLHPDGDRFLFLVPTETESPIHVVLNWQRLLEEN